MRLVTMLIAVVLISSQARAADPVLSLDTKRMLAYGTLAVMTGACKTKLTKEQTEQLNDGLSEAAEKQTQLSEADFTEAMKTVGAEVGQRKEQVCAALTPAFVDASLKDAAAGR